MAPNGESDEPPNTAAPGHRVCYIPEQIDKAGLTSPPTARNTPWTLMLRDLTTLLSIIPRLPNLFLPFSTGRRSDELSLEGRNVVNMIILVIVTCLEVLIFLVMGVSGVVLPGLLGVIVTWLLLGLIWLLCTPLRGPSIVHSSPDGDQTTNAAGTKHERWVFVNGVLQSNHGLKQNCDRLAQIFGRPIVGIHNATNGLIGDLLECVIQRSFSYNNYAVRFTYDRVKAYLIDPKVHKVVLVAHSQGALITSMVLDLLFTDLPAENMAKLEVYTFGSAASHFNNPLRAIDPRSKNPRTGVIRYIEHYVNSEDPVTRWGILYNVRAILENRFAGKVFIRLKATGHMMNQHYLDSMFPLPGEQDEGGAPAFLDEIVDIDETTPEARDELAERDPNIPTEATSAGNGRRSSMNEDMPSNPSATVRTVRDLSRLWRYVGGKSPDVDDEQQGYRCVTEN